MFRSQTVGLLLTILICYLSLNMYLPYFKAVIFIRQRRKKKKKQSSWEERVGFARIKPLVTSMWETINMAAA